MVYYNCFLKIYKEYQDFLCYNLGNEECDCFMNKKKLIIIFTVVIILIVVGVCFYFYYQSNKNIPDDYIAVFHGGSGEITHSTYIYKIDNDQPNYGFRYINVACSTKSWGSSEWNVKVVGKGEVSWTDDVFSVAKENNAYQYVTLPNSEKSYSIEEFQRMFLMN